MVGLSVLLEGYKEFSKKTTPQVISKASMIIKTSPASPTSPSSPTPFSRRKEYNLSTFPARTGFLDHCFLCKQKLLPCKDIYMYKGDRAFCSEECRCRQIFMDEEETSKAKLEQCSFAAIKPQQASSSPSSSRGRSGERNRANGFAC